MRFPNAYKGVKKIYQAELMMLFATVLSLIIIFVGYSSAGYGALLALTNTQAGTIVALTMVMGILYIAAFIILLVGIINAKNDEITFKKALYGILIGIVLSTIAVLFNKVQAVVSPLIDLCKLFTTYYILRGICSLAAKMEDNEVKALAEKACMIVCIAHAVSYLLELFKGNTIILVVISIIGGILDIAGYCYFLKVLFKGRAMLSRCFGTENNMESA